MWPAATDDPDTIYYWINSVVNDDVMSLILQSKAFKRLYDISFLGALDYTHPGTEKISKKIEVVLNTLCMWRHSLPMLQKSAIMHRN